jgi:pimeloyl-ACP methyl ester carboxylesterase
MTRKTFESRFIEAGGLRLHYLDYGTAGLAPMLCVHGGGAHAHWFDPVAPGFTDDYHVRALDLRGHGDSAWSDAADYSFKRFAADIADVAEQLDLRDFVLVGHSRGGMISLMYAASRPPRLGKLVVVDTTMRFSGERIAALRGLAARGGRSYASREELQANFRLRPASTAASPEVLRHVAEHTGRIGPDGRWRHKFDRNTYSSYDLIDGYAQFERVSVPVLLVKGALSDRVTPEVEAQVKAHCRHVEVAEVPESYHHVTLDNPSGFVAVVRKFLQAV